MDLWRLLDQWSFASADASSSSSIFHLSAVNNQSFSRRTQLQAFHTATKELSYSIKFTLYSSAVKSAAFGGNGAKGSNLLQKWIELFLCKISFPAVDLKLFIKFIMRGTQYYNSIVWAYMTLLVIMMKYEKTVNKRYGRLVLILIDQW